MTDKERIEKTYKKIQEKHPEVTDKEQINKLAIEHDIRSLLIKIAICIAAAIVAFVLSILMVSVEFLEESAYVLFLLSISCIAEAVRSFIKCFKVKKRYIPVIEVKNEGQLTRAKIIMDGGRMLKGSEKLFTLIKLPLSDKEDNYENDRGYYLQFDIPESDTRVGYNVKYMAKYRVRFDRYTEAVIGADYYIVLTPDNDIVTVYLASNWTLDNELNGLLNNRITLQQSQPITTEDVNNTVYNAQTHQPSEKKTTEARPKTNKVLQILAIVFAGAGVVLPVYGSPIAVAGMVLSIIGLKKQKNSIYVIALILSIVSLLMLIACIILIAVI